jgi:hypothetical protein
MAHTSQSSWQRILQRVAVIAACLLTGIAGITYANFSAQPAHASSCGSDDFTYTATSANTNGYITTIDSPGTNGQPELMLYVTQLWPNQYDTHPIGIWYDTNADKWTIFNEDIAAIPIGTSFTVNSTCLYQGGGADEVVTASPGTVFGDHVLIDDSVTNNNPNAVVYATQVWTGVYDPHEIGVYYSTVDAK